MTTDSAALVSLRGVSVCYRRFDRTRRRVGDVAALDQVDFDVPPASFLGLTGLSGSGKSTLARCLAGWQIPHAGAIERRAAVQLVPQDAGTSLNPRWNAYEIVAEPLSIHKGRKPWTSPEALLDRAGIARRQWNQRAEHFSGGEKARLAIARALLALPDGHGLIVLDESLSSLDPATRAGILSWLFSLRGDRGCTLMLVSHDLTLLAQAADEIAVLDRGKIVERAPARALVASPRTEASAALVEAMSAD
ncbi:MAG: ATP-binding cassette domain-containing protein [Acidobacteriota bacterium]|nr:ATP-binding cassette domain-containing protein [Acidobacteriota bacterium]